jgi:hypothetical protein
MDAPRPARSRAYVPVAPKNHGYRVQRVQRAAYRALIAAGDRLVTTSEILRRAYPRADEFESWMYAQAREAAARWAVSTGRSTSGSGRAHLWALKPSKSA